MRNFAFILIACVASAAEPGTLEKALHEGRLLSPDDAANLENSLQSDAENADARARLLGHYFHLEMAAFGSKGPIPVAHASRLRHVLWLIEHHPESEIASTPEARMFYLDEGPEYRQQSELWMQQVQRFPQDVRVLKNAANFLETRDPAASLRLMKQAAALQPEDPALSEQLGAMMAGLAMNTRRANAALAEEVRKDLRGCGSVTAAVCKSAASKVSMMVMGRRGTPDLRPQDAELAANLLVTAQNLDPTNVVWTYRLNQLVNSNYGPVPSLATREGSVGGVLGGVPGSVPSAAPNLPGVSAPSTIRVGGNVQASNLLMQVPPVYPAAAKQAGIQGTVRFDTVIAKDGTIENLQLVSGHPLLVQSALDAVKQWAYKPTLLNGQPVRVVTTIDVNFTLSP